MTRIATTLVAALALVAVGCQAEIQSPATARSAATAPADKGHRARATKDQSPAVANAQDRASGPTIHVGPKDLDDHVTPAVQRGKARPGKASRPPADPPPPKEPTFKVMGEFRTTKEKARESAIEAAVAKLHDYLLQQDPGVLTYPTTDMVRKLIVAHPAATESDPEFGRVEVLEPTDSSEKETMYKVEIALRVEPEHVRELRARERSRDALWVLAGAAVLAAVVAVFFRIDAWTKGYLTSWLVLGLVGAGGLLLGLMWWAR